MADEEHEEYHNHYAIPLLQFLSFVPSFFLHFLSPPSHLLLFFLASDDDDEVVFSQRPFSSSSSSSPSSVSRSSLSRVCASSSSPSSSFSSCSSQLQLSQEGFQFDANGRYGERESRRHTP